MDNVVLMGIAIEADPETGEEEPIIPQIQDLHDCIFLRLVSKPALLTGREIRYLRRHLLWTQAEAARKLGYNSPQYVCGLEANGKAVFDIGKDFLWRFECLNRFIEVTKGLRRQQAQRLLNRLQAVLSQIRRPRRTLLVRISRVRKRRTDRWEPFFRAA